MARSTNDWSCYSVSQGLDKIQQSAMGIGDESSDEEESDQEQWDPRHHTMDSKVHTSLRQCTNKQMEGSSKGKDRSDRATVETVLDPRTRMASYCQN